ncbi:spermidine synthase [Croceicoccus mobilis]|uniref:Spermidine synthase n=1 Tax=Croceicoccus mobilis TaxID=1703339 RepID=A0A916YRV4_9SPHN|nr:fused MFS/spermidine synthase [Croceicoccus mobilis]GGD57036.1 hypothetical protein GCM10010990_02840 [Croceicoccus mobilis]
MPTMPPRQPLFVLTILVGSFLLFLVQPMIARFALPMVGGAPNVWNSAMLVFQLLLLGGYLYSHALSRLPVRRQVPVHLALLALAALTLPIDLFDLPAAASGWEVLWVPALFVLSIGPVFFMLASQASLMQRWYAASGDAGDPYVLYGASNLGSFAGLIAYPLLLEPTMALGAQSLLWSAGFALLFVLVVLAGWSRRQAAANAPAAEEEDFSERVPPAVTRRLIALWTVLAAVPSGLMLSTTTLLTTDIMAAPLLWVIPLGLYLLSYTVAFSEDGTLARHLTRIAPITLLFVGGFALSPTGDASFGIALAMVALLFLIAVSLHHRLFELRPDPAHLTLFYLMIALGGALGGVFAALIAPVIFDWIYEHAILLVVAAFLLPMEEIPVIGQYLKRGLLGRTISIVLLMLGALLAWRLALASGAAMNTQIAGMMGLLACLGIVVMGSRMLYVAVLAMIMIGHVGYTTIRSSLDGERARSYFGAYSIAETQGGKVRYLTHGTTMHGQQFTDPAMRDEPTSYYGRTSGVGIAISQAAPDARIGVVGLGVGTLACYRQPDQHWSFFEIDRQVAEFSAEERFTFLSDCTPDARIVIGDARLRLAEEPGGTFDLLAIDAFSSDAIPIHLLTQEAFAVYGDALSENGLLLVHVSNRYFDLAPMVSALARQGGWKGAMRMDTEDLAPGTVPSLWIALTRSDDSYNRLIASSTVDWGRLPPPADRAWSDDNASILPLIRW